MAHSDQATGQQAGGASRRGFVVGGTAFTALLAAGCGTDDTVETAAETTAEVRTFVDVLNREVEVPARPQRIVTLHEVVFAQALLSIGAPVVGTTREASSEFDVSLQQYDLSELSGVGTFAEVNVEAVAQLRPDLIVAYAYGGEFINGVDLATLEAIAPTVGLTEGRPLDEFMTTLGDLTGLSEEVDRQRDEYEAELASLGEDLGPDTAALTVAVLGALDGGGEAFVYSANNPVPWVEIPLALGCALPALAETGDGPDDIYVEFSSERLAEVQTDVLLYNDGAGSPTELTLWSTLPAVEADQAHTVPVFAGGSYAQAREAIGVLRPLLTGADTSIV